MAIKKDGDYKAFIATTKVNHVTDISLSVAKETIDITSFDSQNWKDFTPNDKEWSGSFTAWVDHAAAENFEEAFDDLDGQDTVAILFSTEVVGEMTLGGSCIITGVDFTGSKGSANSYSVSFQGTGTLTKSTVSA